MQLLAKNIIEEFKKVHSSSRRALDRWVRLFEASNFSNPQDVKELFGVNVDFVGNQVIFDVAGNKVRTIAKIEYGIKIVLVTHILTHTEYDRKKWKE